VRVLELGQLIAGPFAGQLLGYVASLLFLLLPATQARHGVARHFGAEVIKVEPPNGGDPLRVWRELDVDGTSPWFRSIGRNKKSVTIDMRKEEGRACVFLLSNPLPTFSAYDKIKTDCKSATPNRLVRRLAERSDVVIENFKPGSTHTSSSPAIAVNRKKNHILHSTGEMGHWP